MMTMTPPPHAVGVPRPTPWACSASPDLPGPAQGLAHTYPVYCTGAWGARREADAV